MSSPLVVLPNSAPSRQAPRNTRIARGTETTNVKNRKLRLNEPGERPWEGRDDDHRGQINVEIEGDAYVVYKPSIGALSALDLKDYIAFTVYTESGGDLKALENYYLKAGLNAKEANAFALGLTMRLERDGWTRTELPEDTAEKLSSVYFTITRWCDLGCPYCYQGLENRVGTEMSVEQAELVLDRIKAINPNCQIIVTGGEPFSHSQVFEILELVNQKGFPFVILSNGTYIDDKTARFLKGLEKFKYVQISLDGATAEVHELTRGKGHFEKAMTGFRNIVANKLAFKVAPTLHEANVHELPQIADLALSNGGWLSPNQLKELPHAGLNYTYVSLSNDTLRQALREVNEAMIGKYGF
ncbi:MAG: radical SAM protein, partial [Acidobacteriota bacterium]